MMKGTGREAGGWGRGEEGEEDEGNRQGGGGEEEDDRGAILGEGS